MFYIPSFIWFLTRFGGATGLFSTVACPSPHPSDYPLIRVYHYPSLDCTSQASCKDPFQIYSKDSHIVPEYPHWNELSVDDFSFHCPADEEPPCTSKHKVSMAKHGDSGTSLEYPCPTLQDPSAPALMPVSGNCSLFYKCNWGSAVLFECPSDLHFNAELQVCDWPWRAHCDYSWQDCPRPEPKCPVNRLRTLYLPHPRACDKFYQCDWGTSHLQSCPTGLHFNPVLKICDWPHRANCRVC